MIDFIIALVMGGIIGWLASIVMRTDAQQGIFLNIIVGCIGSILGRWLLSDILGVFGGGHLRGDAFDWRTLVTAFIGAIILLAIINLFRRGRVR
ncbi:GlsB/YeaQ/YmgE family stress response membrane protein [Sphingopyxis sp.]|uniref:GlsB/YeaQ/YmgE family stress response membrane protein n=1 Tax=Sphingopyxis sp. TaxID=1908224 RepID=UPI0026263AC8|nr:GlsB/YeaQ/YmgE family stress response membrane protein [Sphingopyxis sp.]MCW0198958.1 GlsB/YeaQ/YmgE family stress response membrane protein [Sphingopyxis sp.]